MCVIHVHAVHPFLLSPSPYQSPWHTRALQFRTERWKAPASLPPLQSRENSRTVELYRGILEINFPAEGCTVHVPPVLLRACIDLWRSVIISECHLLLLSLRWWDFLCCGNYWLGNSPFCPLQENLGRLARFFSLLRTFLETWFLLSFKYSHLTGNSDEVSFSFFTWPFLYEWRRRKVVTAGVFFFCFFRQCSFSVQFHFKTNILRMWMPQSNNAYPWSWLMFKCIAGLGLSCVCHHWNAWN